MRAEPRIPGVDNFRDVGGLPAGSGTTRFGILYRSGHLDRVQEDGRAAISDYGIRRIIDLRSHGEGGVDPHTTEGLGIEVQRVPLFAGSVASFFEEDFTLDSMYRRILEDSSASVVEVVRGIVTDQPVLVHCAIGKDRTGVTVALTLAAAGVDEDAVVGDYARTEGMLSPDRNRTVLAAIDKTHPQAVNARDLATRSPAPVMKAMLADIADRYGSAADYLLSHGLTDDEIAELRRVLIAR